LWVRPRDIALLRQSTKEELALFHKLDQQSHAAQYVMKTGLKKHQQYFNDPNITYLTITSDEVKVLGYFMLVNEPDLNSVEFRRILIDQSKLGIGQASIFEMEIFCRNNFNAKRIWLDVFDDNVIGKHIYKKLGYKKFKEQTYLERTLEFYEKNL
jgi:RimJ/RimL family protein N-acetyltransferase